MNEHLRFLTITLTITVLDANGVALLGDPSAPPDKPMVTCLPTDRSASITSAGNAVVTPMMIAGVTLCALSTIIFIGLLIYAAISEGVLRRRLNPPSPLPRATRGPPSVDLLGAPPSDRAHNDEVASAYDPTYSMITSDNVTPRYVESPARTRATKGRDLEVVIEPRNLPEVPAASGSASRHDPAAGANVYSTISGDYANIDADTATTTRTSNTSSIVAQVETTETPRYAVPRQQSVYEAISDDESDITAVTGRVTTPANSFCKREDATNKESAQTGPSELDEGYEVALQAKVKCDVSPNTDRRESDDGYQEAMKVNDLRLSSVDEVQEMGASDCGCEVPQKGITNDEYYVVPNDVTKETIDKDDKRPISDTSVYIFMGKPQPTK